MQQLVLAEREHDQIHWVLSPLHFGRLVDTSQRFACRYTNDEIDPFERRLNFEMLIMSSCQSSVKYEKA